MLFELKSLLQISISSMSGAQPDPAGVKNLPVDTSIKNILITGSAGNFGTAIGNALKDRYRIRGLDLKPTPYLDDMLIGDIKNFDIVREATKGMDAVIHLAEISMTMRDRPQWDNCMESLIGVHNLLEASRINGIRRMGYASATGIVVVEPDDQRRVDMPTRHDSGYTFAKVYAEKLGLYYSKYHGIGFVSVRIGRIAGDDTGINPTQPHDLTYADAVRVFERAVVHPKVKYEIVYGVSDSSWELYDLDHGRRVINYYPQDKSYTEPAA